MAYIHKINAGGTAYRIAPSLYGSCDTVAATAAKVVTCSDFDKLQDGVVIWVKFTYANTVANPTMNVNSTGAKRIYRYGTTSTGTSAAYWWNTGEVVQFLYDSTSDCFYQIGWNNTMYTVYNTIVMTTAAGTAAKVANSYMSQYFLRAGNVFDLYWYYANSYAGALTLNVKNTGAKPLYINGAASSSSNYTVPAGVYTCYYDGTNYYINTDGTVPYQTLPVATTAKAGAVRPDGQTIVVSNGVLTATPAATGLSTTESSGGTTLSQFATSSSNWPTTYACTKNGSTMYGCGWREVQWNDGRLEKWIWGWQTPSTTSTSAYLNNFWREMPLPPSTSTPFADTPNCLWTARAGNTGAGVWVTQQNTGAGTGGSWSSSGWTDGDTVTFSYSFYNNVNGSRPGSTKCLIQVYMSGHWYLPDDGGDDEGDATDYGDWTIGSLVSIGGTSYYPVTGWTVSSTGAGGDNRLKAAVRFLITADSTSGAWHVKAQYAAWTDTGYINTSNGYMLLRRLNSAITTYTNDAGVKNEGDVWSTLDQNQRQGYVYNGVATGNLIWYNRPYIITDCGTVGNGVTVSSKTFYVGTTESGYPQCSVSASTTTPSA